MINEEAIDAIAKILVLPADKPHYIVLAVEELWDEHCTAVLERIKYEDCLHDFFDDE